MPADLEQSRRAAEDRLRVALDASGTGIYRYDFRTQALDWANNLGRVFGFAEPDGLQSLDQLLAVIHPDDLPHVTEAYERSAREGSDFDEEFRIVLPDGGVRWISDRAKMTRDDTGAAHHLTGACTDVTARRNAESEVRTREAYFRSLANSIPQMAWIADGSGRRSWCNDRSYEFSGLGADQLLGDGWEQLHHPDHLARVRAGQQRCFARGEVWEDTVTLRHRDGQWRWFLSRAVPIAASDGRAARWLGTDTDITERVDAEVERETLLAREWAALAEAESAIRFRDDVLAIVAHDLRNPVHTIVMSASTMLELPLSEPDRLRQLAIIRRSAYTMEYLIRDLLDVTRIESGRLAVQRATMQVAPVLEEMQDVFDGQARERGVALDVAVAAELPAVYADRDRIAQALSNLIGNALKFTPPQGHISLGARRVDEFVELFVADTGVGIREEDLPRVFDRFWQGGGAPGRGVGVGLGLAIVRGIVDAHGGRAEAESVVGEGTTVRLRLPMAAEAGRGG